MANYTCYDVLTHQHRGPADQDVYARTPDSAAALLRRNGDCDTAVDTVGRRPAGAKGWVHPNGTTQDGFRRRLYRRLPRSYGPQYWSPRISGTYTQSPDTVWRASGRPFHPAADLRFGSVPTRPAATIAPWANSSMDLGFFTPFHQRRRASRRDSTTSRSSIIFAARI